MVPGNVVAEVQIRATLYDNGLVALDRDDFVSFLKKDTKCIFISGDPNSGAFILQVSDRVQFDMFMVNGLIGTANTFLTQKALAIAAQQAQQAQKPGLVLPPLDFHNGRM